MNGPSIHPSIRPSIVCPSCFGYAQKNIYGLVLHVASSPYLEAFGSLQKYLWLWLSIDAYMQYHYWPVFYGYVFFRTIFLSLKIFPHNHRFYGFKECCRHIMAHMFWRLTLCWLCVSFEVLAVGGERPQSLIYQKKPWDSFTPFWIIRHKCEI